MVKGRPDNAVQKMHEHSRLPMRRRLCVVATVVRRGALEDAAQEDTRDDLHDSDDDLSASSEDEDDLEEKTERMPEPGPSKSAEMEGLATSGALKHSSEARAGHGLQGMSYIQTMAGVRPSVAFQMQEMQGPSDDNELDPNNVEANQTQEQGSIAKGKSDTGGTDGFLKEYMVREGQTALPGCDGLYYRLQLLICT